MVRDGVAIDLIDRIELCRLLREKELAVFSETVEQVTPESGFFDAL